MSKNASNSSLATNKKAYHEYEILTEYEAGIELHSPYEQGNIFNRDPLRSRKLLLHRKEINQLMGKVQEKGLTLVATKSYLKGRKIKVQVALARGKKLYDKRASIKEKDVNRELERDFKIKFK